MRAARTDANQKSIVAALEAVGASVQLLHRVGGGCPDLLVGFRSENYLMEVKLPTTDLNELQEEWHSNWNGCSFVVRSTDDALKALGIA